MTINQLRKRSNNFVQNLPQIIASVVDFNEDIENLNKQQLQESILANGSEITNLKTGVPDYSPSYAAWKSQMYPQSFGNGKINLFLTGDLYANMDLKVTYPEYKINSTVPYVPKLARKYSDLIFGIAPKNRQSAQVITSNLLAAKYKEMVLQ